MIMEIQEKPSNTKLIQAFERQLKLVGGMASLMSRDESAEYISNLIHTEKARIVVATSSMKTLINVVKAKGPILEAEIYVIDEQPAARDYLEKADIGITHADYAIAETGTIAMTTRNELERLASALPKIHVAVLSASKIVERLSDLKDYFRTSLHQRNDPCVISLITGPSKTGDIEMQLSNGAHGPYETHVLFQTD